MQKVHPTTDSVQLVSKKPTILLSNKVGSQDFRPTFKEIIFIFFRTFAEINNLTTSSEGSMEANLKNSLLGDNNAVHNSTR